MSKIYTPIPLCPRCTIPLSKWSLTNKLCAVCEYHLEATDGGVIVDLQINAQLDGPIALDEIYINMMLKKDDY